MKIIACFALILGLSTAASAQFQPPIVPDADYEQRIEKIAGSQLKKAGYTSSDRAAALPLIRAKLDLNRLRDNIDPCLRAIARWSDQDTCWVKLKEPVAMATHNYMAATQVSSERIQQPVSENRAESVIAVSPVRSADEKNMFLTDTKPIQKSEQKQISTNPSYPSSQALSYADKLVDRVSKTAILAMTMNGGKGGTVYANTNPTLSHESYVCDTDMVGTADGIVRFTLSDSCRVNQNTVIPGLEVAAAINASAARWKLTGNDTVCTGKICAFNFE